jgi:hypothetical protein
MVNWHDPALVLKEQSTSCCLCTTQYRLTASYYLLVASIKLSHAVAAVYMSVFVLNGRKTRTDIEL